MEITKTSLCVKAQAPINQSGAPGSGPGPVSLKNDPSMDKSINIRRQVLLVHLCPSGLCLKWFCLRRLRLQVAEVLSCAPPALNSIFLVRSVNSVQMKTEVVFSAAGEYHHVREDGAGEDPAASEFS